MATRHQKEIVTFLLKLFRAPFINGRPQDLVSVFWKKPKPLFLRNFPLFFSFTSFSFTSFVRGHQESPGVTRGHQRETGGDCTALHCSALLSTTRHCSALLGTSGH